MEFIPAIDLLDGSCVRLKQGSYDNVDRYQLDPVEVARGFAEQGAARIHLVDLNAARGKDEDARRGNRDIIRKIAAAIDVGIEVGGGVRTELDVAELLAAGASHVVVGTALVRKPDEVARWIRRFGPVVLAGIDARDGQVRVAGWEESTGMADTDAAVLAADIGCAGIIYTNIARDGMMQGPDLERTNAIAEAAGIPVILSGGISSHDDIEQVAAGGHALLAGVISGRAIYEQAIDVARAVLVVRNAARRTARIWNLQGNWSAWSQRSKPAMVIDQRGQVVATLHQNPKAAAKSTEQGVVWHMLPENGRVLPAELPGHALHEVIEHDSCYEVRIELSGEGSASAVPTVPSEGADPANTDEPAAAGAAGSVLLELEKVIRDRKTRLPEGSYTTHLFTSGEAKIRKKTGEEAVELILAETNPEMISESADLLYHLLVLLTQRGISVQEVIRELSRR